MNIPTTETGKRMIASVSPIYDKAYTARWLFEIMGIELEEARTYIEELRYQASPETSTWGLFYWEQRYHIPTDETLPLETRRQKVMSKRWKYAPMNPARLEQYITQASGRTAEVKEHNDEYRIEIIINGAGLFEYQKIIDLIRRAKPSHIATEIVLESSCSIRVRPEVDKCHFQSRAAGTYPYRNIQGSAPEAGITAEPGAAGFVFENRLCGMPHQRL